ncbi:MAG: hypothetical protein R6X12_01820 [bacterium]
MILLTAAAASAAHQVTPRPRSWYELENRVRELTEALTLTDSRAVFRLFVPTFQEEISFASFDSAFARWHGGRRVAIAQGRSVGTRGISGQASTWVVFGGEEDYEYIYQAWVFADEAWQVAWLSNILDQSFAYGNRDSLEVRAIRAAALDWLVGTGLAAAPLELRRPDTILVVHPSGAPGWLPRYPTVVCTPDQLTAGTGLPAVPFAFRFALTRNFGSVALCAIDILPLKPRRPGAPRRTRSIQVFLERDEPGWRYLTTGTVW